MEVNKSESHEWEHTSPEEIKSILGTILMQASDEELEEVSEKIKNIRTFVLDKFPWDECAASPYWHALAGSTMKKGVSLDINSLKQKKISETIIGSVKRLSESLQTSQTLENSASQLLAEIIQFEERLRSDSGALTYFRQEMLEFINILQKQYPDVPLSDIPEIQHLISGSEVVNSETIEADVVSEVLASVNLKFKELKVKIERGFNLGSATHS